MTGGDPTDGADAPGTGEAPGADPAGNGPGDRTGRLIARLEAGEAGEPARQRLERRVAASAALADVARAEPASLREHLPVLLEELRRTGATAPDATAGDNEGRLQANLVRCLAHVVAADPGALARRDAVADVCASVTADLDDGTVQVAAETLFAAAGECPAALGPAVDALGDLVAHPDAAVQAWSAGALGRLAGEHPDAVAAAAPALHDLLDHGDPAVQHNAVEALGHLVQVRPDPVAAATPELRALLDHDDTAVQHNAAGVLGHLVDDHPEAVAPAADRLRALCDHDEAAVRRVASGVLVRLADARPDTDS